LRPRSVLIAVAAGLALADASIVTLALPQLLTDLHTTVDGVAAVIGVYTIVLAASLIPAERMTRRYSAPAAGAVGFGLFAVACIGCAGADSLAVLLIARALQAVGGATALVVAFTMLAEPDARSTEGSARRLWLYAAVISAAAGPALGGALTQAFTWPAIFIAQAPIAAIAALVCWAAQPAPPVPAADDTLVAPRRVEWRAAAALALVSAALSAVLFLLVLLLVAGWAVHPLAAAASVTIVPASALAGSRMQGDPRWRAAAGCLLVALGTLALAYLPNAHIAWTFAPQAFAGFGMGLALPALGGELLPERNAHDAAVLLTMRHVGIAVALAILAPITATRLDNATREARQQGIALALDARISPVKKLQLAPVLLESVDESDPRAELKSALHEARKDVDDGDLAAYDTLAARADDTLVNAVGDSFYWAFLITGLMAALGAALLVRLRRPPAWVPVAGALAAIGLVGQIVAWHSAAPAKVVIRDPCVDRPLPNSGGLTGFLQDRVLNLLDAGACRLHVSREELVLALADKDEAKRFRKEHGVDPRNVGSLVAGLFAG
jgi:predicted MFS family arabinose efflux permease